MPKLDEAEPYNWARALRDTDDDTVSLPLWVYPPEARKAVESERARRGLLRYDPEPIGDPEFS